MKEQNNKKSKVLKIIIFSIIVIILVSAILLYIYNENARIFMDKYIFRKEISEENLVQIDISEIENPKFFAYENNILILSKNTLSAYNSSGNKRYEMNIEITNPIFKVNDNYLCVAEKNGQKIYVIKGQNILWQKEVESPITNIEINKNGFVAVSMLGTSYKSIVEIYNNEGTKQLKTYLSTTNVVSMELSNDNKYLAIVEVNYSGSLIQSNIKLVDIEQAKQNSQNTDFINYSVKQGELIIKIKYVDNVLVCMCDTAMYKIEENEFKVIIDYANEDILFADIDESVMLIKKIKSNLVNTEIEVICLDVKSGKRNIYKLDKEPKSIYMYKNSIAINTGTQLTVVDNHGWLIKQYNSLHEINQVVLTDNIIGIIYKNNLGLISI